MKQHNVHHQKAIKNNHNKIIAVIKKQPSEHKNTAAGAKSFKEIFTGIKNLSVTANKVHLYHSKVLVCLSSVFITHVYPNFLKVFRVHNRFVLCIRLNNGNMPEITLAIAVKILFEPTLAFLSC